MKVSMSTSTSGPMSGTLAATARSAAAAVRPVTLQATRYGRTCPETASGIPYSSGPKRYDASAQPRPTPRMVRPATHKAWRHSGPGRRDSSSPSKPAQLSGLGRPGDSVTPRKTRPGGRRFPPESPTDAFASAEKHRRALGVEPVARFVTPPSAFRRFPSDGNDPSVHAPGADGRGQPLRAQRPGPAEVSRMELQRRAVVLPDAEGIHDPGQPIDAGLVQNDRHVPHLTPSRRPAAPGFTQPVRSTGHALVVLSGDVGDGRLAVSGA